MTDPAVLAGDGSTVDYCALPELDGSGLMATDIPKGNTPGCAYEHFPMPILADCTEPLVEGAQDIRGLWASSTIWVLTARAVSPQMTRKALSALSRAVKTTACAQQPVLHGETTN